MPNRDAVRESARGHWRSILFKLGIDEGALSGRHCPCPACGGQDRFRFDDKDSGSHICNQCGAGDGFSLLMKTHRWTFTKALKAVADVLGGNFDQLSCSASNAKSIEPKAPNFERYERILKVWGMAKPIMEADPAGQYLTRTRGIPLTAFPSTLRYSPRVWTMIDREPRAFPTMLAAYSDPSGELVQVERLFLTPGGQKAPIANPKRLMPQWKNSCMDGAAVRLYEPAERMGIAEGIATALRCSSESDLPVWATGSRIWMEKVWIPPMVQELIIFADNDESGDGLRSAKKLASRAVADGLKVKVVVPPKVGADWDDVVCEDVCQ